MNIKANLQLLYSLTQFFFNEVHNTIKENEFNKYNIDESPILSYFFQYGT